MKGELFYYDNILLLFFRYEIFQCGDLEKLIKKRQNLEEIPMYYVSIGDRMLKELGKKCQSH